MLNFEFDAIANGEIDFYPPELRGEIDAINDFIYTDIIRASTAAASHNHRALCRSR